MIKKAGISECGKYRRYLVRQWGKDKTKTVTFVMLNPSTADHEIDDPTVRRCVGFAKDWGFHRLIIVNLFAYRATDPQELYKIQKEEDFKNNFKTLWVAANNSEIIICAWGNHGAKLYSKEQFKKLKRIFEGQKVFSIGPVSKTKQPKHPLYLKKDEKRIPFSLDEIIETKEFQK